MTTTALKISASGTIPAMREGVRYCGSRCGRGCTRAEYDAACADAAALAERMGGGWTGEVWENLGWHHKVACGVFEIYPNKARGKHPETFTAYVQTHPQFVAEGASPEQALADALAKARAVVATIQESLATWTPVAGLTVEALKLTTGENP